MASTHCEQSSETDDECAICMDVLVDPCVLPCSHSFCRKCLLRHCELSGHCTVDQQQEDSVICPTCRQVWPLLTDTSHHWLHECQRYGEMNEFLPHEHCATGGTADGEFVGEFLPASASSSTPVKCNSCGLVAVQSDEGRDAETSTVHCISLTSGELHRCINCCQNLCSQCVVIHGRLTATKSHLVVPLTRQFLSASAEELHRLPCPKHEDSATDLFCWHCRQLVCMSCSLSSEHVDHSCDDVVSSLAQLRSLLLTDTKTVTECQQRCSQMESDVAADKSRWLSSIQMADNKIEAAADKLRSLIDKQCCLLRDQLASVKQLRLKQLQSRGEEVEQQRARLNSLTKNIQSVINAPSDMQILLQAGELHESIGRCLADFTAVTSCSAVSGHQAVVLFSPAEWSALGSGAGGDSLIGRVEVVGAVDDSQRPLIEPLKATSSRSRSAVRSGHHEHGLYYRELLATLSDQHSPVCGLVVVADRLYVCHSRSAELDVYDASKTTYRRQRSIRVPGLTEPTDMAMMTATRAGSNDVIGTLFVSSENDGLVFRVTLTTRDELHRPWPTDDRPYGVSINKHLLVLSRQASSVSIYDVNDLRQLRRLRLPASVCSPWSVVHCPAAAGSAEAGELLVCHGETSTDADGRLRRCVSRLDARTGAVRRRLSWVQMPAARDAVASDSSVLHMVTECDVDGDGGGGGLLVADEHCDSVRRVDVSLTSHESLLELAASDADATVDQPRRLCVDSARQRLLVGLDDGRVKVFANSCAVM